MSGAANLGLRERSRFVTGRAGPAAIGKGDHRRNSPRAGAERSSNRQPGKLEKFLRRNGPPEFCGHFRGKGVVADGPLSTFGPTPEQPGAVWFGRTEIAGFGPDRPSSSNQQAPTNIGQGAGPPRPVPPDDMLDKDDRGSTSRRCGAIDPTDQCPRIDRAQRTGRGRSIKQSPPSAGLQTANPGRLASTVFTKAGAPSWMTRLLGRREVRGRFGRCAVQLPIAPGV